MLIKIINFIYIYGIVGYMMFGFGLFTQSILNRGGDIEIKRRESKVYLASIGFSFCMFIALLLNIRTFNFYAITICSNILFLTWIRSKYSEIESIEYKLKNEETA